MLLRIYTDPTYLFPAFPSNYCMHVKSTYRRNMQGPVDVKPRKGLEERRTPHDHHRCTCRLVSSSVQVPGKRGPCLT